VPIVASKKEGIDQLKAAIRKVAAERRAPATRVEYDSEVEEAIEDLLPRCRPVSEREGVDARWLAIKLLEQDQLAVKLSGGEFADLIRSEAVRIHKHTNMELRSVITDGRYGFIRGLARDVVRRDLTDRRHLSDAIDQVVLSRVLGVPIFLMVIYLVFLVTIQLGRPFIDFFDILFDTVFVRGGRHLLEGLGSPEILTALLADGVGGGLQVLGTFIPPIFLIFLCLSILEDSGYMARAAFVMDRFMRAIGLPGKAFLPMLVGFGCNVPAILATRTLENRRDRVMTILINPFMSCGARLPVYTVFTVAFFPAGGGLVVFGLYVVGIVLAILTGLLFRGTILRGKISAFVMELPPYHMPTLTGVMHHTWHRLKSFLLRAGKVIMIVVAAMALLNSIGGGKEGGSVLDRAGRAISPVFRPMGVSDDNWPASVGLLTGVFAKESVVGTLNTLYTQMDRPRPEAATRPSAEPAEEFDFWAGVGEALLAIPEGLAAIPQSIVDPFSGGAAREAGQQFEAYDPIRRHFATRAAAVAYLLFILIYAPCVAVIAAIYRETNLGWAVFAVCYLTGLAWVVSTIYYQAATFMRHPASSAAWIAGCAAALVALYVGLRLRGPVIRQE